MMVRKEAIRQRRLAATAEKELSLPDGKIAEQLRRLAEYRTAKEIFAGPAAVLKQIRVNALADGKKLLMPAPGLRDGFFLLEPYSIPFQSLSHAVTHKGLPRFGRKVDLGEMKRFAIDILMTDAWAVDQHGVMVGDGKGFFDLAAAILAELGALAPTARYFAAGPDDLVVQEEIPADPWDVFMDKVLTPGGILTCRKKHEKAPAIQWEHLALDRIKRITPLWKLSPQGGGR